MDLPIGLVFEIMLFRSPFYRNTNLILKSN